MTEGQASISPDILARYASDAANGVDGVRGLVGRHGVRVGEDGRVELRLEVDWASRIPTLGRLVQERVGGYLARMTQREPPAVDVVVDRIGPLE